MLGAIMLKKIWRNLLLVALLPLLLWSNAAHAQSACTAMWGITNATELSYFNRTTNQWITAVTGLPGNPNALSGSTASNLLYFVNRNTRELHSYNPVTNAVSTAIGVIPVPPAPAVGTNILGSTFDTAGRLHVYATQGSPNPYMTMAQIDPSNPSVLLTAWTQILTTVGATPTVSGSGDINCDNAGTCYLISNTAPPTYHVLNTTPGPSYARTNSPSITITGAGNPQVAGVAVDPVTGILYFGSSTAGSSTYSLDPGTGVAIPVTTTPIISDLGNCPFPPAPPTVAKSITPSFIGGSTGNQTATLTLTLGNSNTNPLFLNTAFTDNLPAGMVVATPSNLSSTCNSVFGTATATVGATSVTLPSGSRLPLGSCSISLTVSATAAINPYINTIPPNALVTTAGNNNATVTASLTVGTDFSIVKSQRQGTVNPLQTTTLSTLAGQTVQYVLQITNSASGQTGSVAYTDTLPADITPVFSVTAASSGGGTCSTATAVVGTRTQITGNFSNAPAGASCLITVTALASAAITNTTVQNTAGIAAFGTTADANPANNLSTVTTTISPAVNLAVAKTDGLTTVKAGDTTTYTVTFTNSGPSNGTGSVVLDTPSAGLSSCTVVSCTGTGTPTAASCPATPANLLVGPGATVPNFPANTSLVFTVRCRVSATGF
jgi:uncharacterized repeat protein (TIGR01451 family)